MATGSTLTAGTPIVLGALGLLLATVYRIGGWDNPTGPFYRIAPWYLVVGILAAFGMLLSIHGPRRWR